MKYINREYGFPGRPPYFKDFYEEQEKGPAVTSACYPGEYLVGAGLDVNAPNGALLVGKFGSMWGIRLSYYKNGSWVDAPSFVHDVGMLYAGTQKGNFTYFSHGDITATFTAYNQNSIVISVSAIASTSLRVIFYPVQPSEGVFKANEKQIKGSAPYRATIKGKPSISEEGCVFRSRYDAYSDRDADTRECFIAQVYTEPNSIHPSGDSVIYEYSFSAKKDSRLLIYAEVGNNKIFSSAKPSEEELIAGISSAEIQYASEKTSGSGPLAGNLETAVNSVMWHRLFNPYFLSTTYFARRDTANEYYSFSGLEQSIALLTGALLGDAKSSLSGLPFVIGDKLMALLATWVVFSRTRDYDLLTKMYPALKSAYSPTHDLVLSNKNKAMVAYKMDGSPLKETYKKENVYSLDMSSVALLGNDIMERIALIAGKKADAAAYAEAKRALKAKINDVLWNADLGIYMNRYEDGTFADAIGITSFYPLVAGAVDDLDRISSVLSYLTNQKKFWGEYAVPTLAKDHPEYGKKIRDLESGRTIAPYESYHGEISPIMNYFVYLGLVRIGADNLAEELALKSGKLYKKYAASGKTSVLSSYLPNGKMPEKGGTNNIEGNLMAAMGACSLIDVEYFCDDLKRALRFGTIAKGEHFVNNLTLFDKKYSITVRDNITYLVVDGKERFTGEGGKFVVRQFFEKEDYCEFLIDAEANLKLTLILPLSVPADRHTKVIFAVEQGKSRVVINGSKVKVNRIK